MRNRAKCKLCNNIIESFTILDVIECKCGEIEIWGGTQKLGCAAKDWSNFLRVDDNDKEHPVTVKNDSDAKPLDTPQGKPTRLEMLDMLDEMVKSYENLPRHALEGFATNQDLTSILILLSAILRAAD